MCAIFHSDGKLPVSNDSLNINDIGFAIDSAQFFKIVGLWPSDPADLSANSRSIFFFKVSSSNKNDASLKFGVIFVGMYVKRFRALTN